MQLSDAQRQRIAQYVRGYLARTALNYGHTNAEHRATARWMHTLNVVKNLKMICQGEGVSPESRVVCEVAAFFHDVDHYTVELQYHGVRGAETAMAFLKKESYDPEFTKRVGEIVRGHHHDLDDEEPIAEQMARIVAGQSHEASMLMDAETLDKIGATNILQAVLTLGGVKHPQVHEVAQELTAGWPLQRAKEWNETLVTTTGKLLGAQRLAFHEQFLRQIAEEIVLEDIFPQPSMRTQEMLQLP